MNLSKIFFAILIMLFSINSYAQKTERIGIIDMEYILSKMEDYTAASEQLQEKIGEWKNEIESQNKYIENLKDSLEIERPLMTKELIEDRESEIDFEVKKLNDYKEKRFGVNGDWIAQELLLIKPIQDQVLNVVQSIAKQKKFDKIFDQSADAIVLYSEKKYDISDLVLKSILREDKLEKLNIEFNEDSLNPELEERKKLLEEKKAQKAEEIKSRRELILKQKEEKREAYLKKRDSLLKLRRKKITIKKFKKMKIFKKLTAAVLLMFVSFTVTAQSKVAHIDSQALISEMPEVKEAQAQLEKLQKTYSTEIDASMKEYQTKLQTYSADAQNQTEVTNQARQKELAGMEQNIQQYQQTASQDIQKKQADLLRPLIEKARAAIQKVARAQGFDYVIDGTQGGSLILADGKDLMEDVKKELGF